MSKATTIKLNAKQLQFHQACTTNQADYQKDGKSYQGGFRATFQGARGSGKSRELCHLIAESAFQLPRARAGLAGLTYRQVQDIILSQAGAVLEEHGLYEYDPKTRFGHYVINRRPPDHWHTAINPIRTFDNCLAFCNGYTTQFISADREETTRGANFDQLLIDESATIKETFYNRVLRPTVRANKHIYKDPRPGRKGFNHPLHWLIADFTSAPWLPSGQWVYKTEELQKLNPSKYFFLESTAYDNLDFLPGSFIDDQREACGDELTFNVEILNHRVTGVPDGFYHALDGDKHGYSQGYSYEFDDQKRIYLHTRTDYDLNKPLDASFDFNAVFTSLTLWQDHTAEYRCIDTQWVKSTKEESLVKQLVLDFCEKYKDHRKKLIYVYGDGSAHKRDPGRNKTYFQTIKDTFTEKGWQVVDKIQSFYPSYSVRYRVINSLLQETNVRLPKIRINQTACKPLLISCKSAPVDGTSFEKIKTSEQQKGLPQEYATHLSDTFDYVLMSKFAKYVAVGGTTRTGGITVR